MLQSLAQAYVTLSRDLEWHPPGKGTDGTRRYSVNSDIYSDIDQVAGTRASIPQQYKCRQKCALFDVQPPTFPSVQIPSNVELPRKRNQVPLGILGGRLSRHH